METNAFKTCPFCKEKIRQEAIKCRFCGEWIVSDIKPVNPPSDSTTSESPTSKEFSVPSLTSSVETAAPILEPPKKPQTLGSAYGITALFLLAICASTLVFVLTRILNNHLTSADESEFIEMFTGGLLKVVLGAALISWTLSRKGYRLLSFSIACTVFFAIGAYYFFKALNAHRNQEINRIVASNLASIQKYISQGAAGEMPELLGTGDSDKDAFFKLTKDVYTEYFKCWRIMNADFIALQESNILNCVQFTNKSAFILEAQKRVNAQQIVQAFAANAKSIFAGYRKKCLELRVSQTYKNDLIKGIDVSLPRIEAEFLASVKSQQIEEAFLRFLYENFDNYEIINGKISFTTTEQVQKYKELAQSLDNSTTDLQSFRKEGQDVVAGGIKQYMQTK